MAQRVLDRTVMVNDMVRVLQRKQGVNGRFRYGFWKGCVWLLFLVFNFFLYRVKDGLVSENIHKTFKIDVTQTTSNNM